MFVIMKFTLSKEERLKSKKLIEKLYTEGNSIKVFPLRIIYLQTEHTSKFAAQAGVSVSKRNFKRAVDRNRIKRLLRESYRKQKYTVYNNLEKPYIFMISYLAKTELSFSEIDEKMRQILLNFIHKTKEENDKK